MSALTPAQDSTDCRDLCTEHKFKESALDKEKVLKSKWLQLILILDTGFGICLHHVLSSKVPLDPTCPSSLISYKWLGLERTLRSKWMD